MNRTIMQKSKNVKRSPAGTDRQQTIWMIAVDGETFVLYSKAEENRPTTMLARLRGRREFSSEKQAKAVKDWYTTLYPPQAHTAIKPDLTLVEISDLDLIAISKMGLASGEMGALAQRLDLQGKEIAKLLTLSQRTFHRRKPEQLLDHVASERLLMLTKLADHGFDVFEDQGKFNRWLRRPLRILGNQAPLDILDTSQGIKMVDTILGRIEYGVYS